MGDGGVGGALWWHPLGRNPITSGNCGCYKQLPFVSDLIEMCLIPDNVLFSRPSLRAVSYVPFKRSARFLREELHRGLLLNNGAQKKQ